MFDFKNLVNNKRSFALIDGVGHGRFIPFVSILKTIFFRGKQMFESFQMSGVICYLFQLFPKKQKGNTWVPR